MSRTTGKRGFAPAQVTSAIQSMDFDATAEAFAAALAQDTTGQTDAGAERISDNIAQAADRLLSIPAHTPAQIAQKVAAYGWLTNATPRLEDPATQHRIAAGNDDAAKGLLAIYLDLTGLSVAKASERAAWEAAVSSYGTALAKRDVLTDASDDEDDAYNAASDEAWALLEALLATPAPDGAAMGMKARLVIEQAHTDWQGDSPDNPLTIARLLAGDWSETALASLYIDGLRLSGSDSPIVNTKPDNFNAEAWLSEVEEATGARLSKSDQWHNVTFTPARDGADVVEATARLAGLYQDHQGAVETFAANRDRGATFPFAVVPLTDAEVAAGREALIDALANLSARGADRLAVRAKIAEAATPWVLTVEERGTAPIIRKVGE